MHDAGVDSVHGIRFIGWLDLLSSYFNLHSRDGWIEKKAIWTEDII